MSYSEAQYIIDEASSYMNDPIKPKKVVGDIVLEESNGVIWPKISFIVNDNEIDGHVICQTNQVVIVRKYDSAPTSIDDGTVAYRVNRGSFVVGQTYTQNTGGYDASVNTYYALYPISMTGIIGDPCILWINKPVNKFAYHHDFTVLNPDKCITYLDWGDLSSAAKPIISINKSGSRSYGSFKNFFIFEKNKPYMVKTNFTADYALDPNDYTKKLDGSASDVSNTSYSGLGAYAWFPKFYMKEVYAEDGNSRDVYISDTKVDSGFYPIGFFDYSIGEVKGIWIPMYYIGSDGKSFANRAVNDTCNKTTDQQKTIIDKAGSNARFLGGSFLNAFRDLCYGLYKSTDIQKHGGYGNSYGSSFTNNEIINNIYGIIPGFYGTTGSSSSHEANKAFHSNVLFTYDMELRDPYTLADMDDNNEVQIKIRSYNRYSLSTDNYDGDIISLRTPASNNLSWEYYSIFEKLHTINNIGHCTSVPIRNNASASTGPCDGQTYLKPIFGRTFGVGTRFGGYALKTHAGPGFLRIDNNGDHVDSLTGAANMLLPSTTSYQPS